MNEKLLKPYDPVSTESRIYKLWEESGFFNPDACIEHGVTKEDARPFTIIMPPPNVTGVLHMGHAMMLTLQDIMIRYKRMQGFRTLWIPGTDHAAIATQSKVEKEIQKQEGKSRHDLGREELVRRTEKFAQESHDTIVSQIRVMGSSCDWSREAYTLDEKRSLAVRTMFKKMFDDGLIYRGNRIVNWDPKGQTTIADDEIVHEERTAKLYTFKYSKDFPISISTTRPETKVGDTAVAVHPDDTRYAQYIGQEFTANFCGVEIRVRIIADESVDMEFGTGALGVTPAHSFTDWDIAKRHDLEAVQVINEYAKMMMGDERILGKKTTEAREIIVEWLRSEGLMEKEEDTVQNVATAERTGGIIEPLPKLQWFIDVNKEFTISESQLVGIPTASTTTLKEIMRKVVSSGQIKIIPDHFDKTYFHWIDNLRDWCISRQIWYGHRIPVWYRSADAHGKSGEDEIFCDVETPEGDGWEQDTDTLDTWFSSGLWTFSTLGWPDQTPDLDVYHPTDILETGHEILFFWVARMVLMTGYGLGNIPFQTVYLHGTVRDAQGRKMSKSLGNGIDPLDIAEKYGADAGRMALIVGITPGTDSKISEDKIKGYKNFANKIWNITRFIVSTKETIEPAEISETFPPNEQSMVNDLRKTIQEISDDLDSYRFHIASEKIYHYIWHTFADKIIEESKTIFFADDEEAKRVRLAMLIAMWSDCLKVLHPFMPFVTEELWGIMSEHDERLLMIESWPS